MKTILLISQILVSVLLIITILLQQKGTGLSTVFGGESSFYRSKRGVEKFLIYATVFLILVFLVLSILQITV